MKNFDNFFRTTAPAIKDVDEIRTDEYKVEAVVVLDAEEFEDFRRRLFVARDFIADNRDYMYLDRNGISHCLLVLGEGKPDGILVDSGLSQHAKFTSFLPNAADFMEKQIRMMADEMLENFETAIDFKSISDKFDVTVTADNGIGQMLIDELRGRNELANVEVTLDSIELTRVENAPVEVDDKHLMTLFMLMGCNLENVHIVDAAVEHDLATIVELNQDNELCAKIEQGLCTNEKLVKMVRELSERLKTVKGKKQYGYLPKSVKAMVDEIVDELSEDERIKRLYELWYESKCQIFKTYTDDPPPMLPLSMEKEFKPIRNAVVRRAAEMAVAMSNDNSEVISRVARLGKDIEDTFQDRFNRLLEGHDVAVDSKLRREIEAKKMGVRMSF